MSAALDDVCKILDLADEAGSEREFLAKKIIAFAHQGQRDAALLRDRMLREIVSGRGEWPAALSAPLKAERFKAGVPKSDRAAIISYRVIAT
jgi:hypothetical protein